MYTDPNQIANGFGIDLGFYGHFNEKVSAQLSMINLGSFLKSKQGTNWKSINSINLSATNNKRRKRRELSVSATKTLNKHKFNVVLAFD